MYLTDEQIRRYSRHILLPGVGGVGQERLLASSTLVVFEAREESAATLALVYLAAAGVGCVGWCPLEGEGASAFSAFLGKSAEAGVRSLNPDVRLLRVRPGESPEAFDALLWLGGESAGFARWASAARIVLCGASHEDGGAVAEGVFDAPQWGVSAPEGGGCGEAARGALGAWLAARAACLLVAEMDTVGSTTQARFDFARGVAQTRARLS